MDPAVNRGQAERCLQKAREAYKSGELETARRLASKSNRLCPSSQAQDFLSKLTSECPNNEGGENETQNTSSKGGLGARESGETTPPSGDGAVLHRSAKTAKINTLENFPIYVCSLDPLPITSMATNVEYKALSQCASDVVALLHHTNLSVASKLLARGLIANDVYTWVLSAHGVSDLEKSNRLFSCVSTRVKSSPRCFHDFVDVLSEEPYFTDVVNELNTVYESMSQSSESMQPSGGLAASGSTVTTTQLSPRMYEKPELKDAFRTLLSLAAEWKTIGTLLGLQNHVLDRIKADEDGVRNRLQGMLSEWLKQVEPSPTWAALAEAVDSIDESKAQEIRSRFS